MSGAQVVVGMDNNMRADFFGPGGDTRWNLGRLRQGMRHYRHYEADIRNRESIKQAFAEGPFDLIIHCAAQPSHDLAARRPIDDFEVNALGTLNVLETTRQMSPEAVFVFMSTNKGVRRCAQRDPAEGTADAMGICAGAGLARGDRGDADRPLQALGLRGQQGGGRRDGAGIRAVLWDEDDGAALRVPDRAASTREWSCMGFCHI